MVCVEAALGGQRKPLAALDAKRTYHCDEADAQFANQFLALTGGKLAAMATARRGEFADLLAALAGHPRVTFGKSTAVTIEREVTPPALENKPPT